jgi:hypothetical protein
MPEFHVVYAGPETAKSPPEYLLNPMWMNALDSVVKGVNTIAMSDDMMVQADNLALAMEQRYHIAERVDLSRHHHWTLHFTRDNLPTMAAAMCVVGHIVEDLDTYSLDECLLQLPMTNLFQMITGDLSGFEGCYLYYDSKKNKWIRSGKHQARGTMLVF